MTNSPVAVPTGDKPYRTHLHIKARPTQLSAVGGGGGGRHSVALDGDTQGKRRLAAVVSGSEQRGSDSETRRRDERVKFAEDTVVQTPDGRTIITDDRSHSKRSHSISGTLPARLRGRRSLPDFEQRDGGTVDLSRVARASTQQRGVVQARPLSAVFDDDGPNSISSVTVRTGSVPSAINVLHRGNSAAAALAKSRKVVAVSQPSSRRVAADVNYHRDAPTVRLHRR